MEVSLHSNIAFASVFLINVMYMLHTQWAFLEKINPNKHMIVRYNGSCGACNIPGCC